MTLDRVERCWLRLLVIVLIVAPPLAVAGLGGTLAGLAGFLVMFAVVSTLVMVRELRPGVSLLSSAQRGRGVAPPHVVDSIASRR